jgi:hypothetical protein
MADRAFKAIYVKDLDAIMKKMEEFAPKIQKQFKKELRKQIRPVERLAESFVPAIPFQSTEDFGGWRTTDPYYPLNWGWAYDTDHRSRQFQGKTRWVWSQEEVKSGIQITSAKVKAKRERGIEFSVTALALVNKSIPGIIYELTGFGNVRSRRRTKKVSRNPKASEQFIQKVQDANPSSQKRLIYRATALKGKQALDGINQVLVKYLGRNFRE